MSIVARPLSTPAVDPVASLRHRAVLAESFPASSAEYEVKEAAYVRSLLVDPLRELAEQAADAEARALAEGALAYDTVAPEPFAQLALFENALERIASTTTDSSARELAEDALALYRGR